MSQNQESPLATKDPLVENNVVSSTVNQNESIPSPIHKISVIDPPRKKRRSKKEEQAAALAGPIDYTDPYRNNQSTISRDAAGAEADAYSRPGVSQRATSEDYFNQKYFWMNVGRVTEADRMKNHFGFNPFAEDTDYEKIRKDNQGTIMTGLNLANSFAAKSVIHTIGGVSGFFVSGALAAGQEIGNVFIEDDKEAYQGSDLFIDNAYMRAFDDAAEGVDKGFSVFTSESDKRKGAFGFLSLVETAKSVSDALAFTTGAIASEVLFNTLGNAVIPGGGSAAGAGYLAGRMGSWAARKAGSLAGVNSKLKKYGETARLVFDRIDDLHNTPEAIARAEKALNSSGKTVEDAMSLIRNARKFSEVTRGMGVAVRTTHYEASMEARQAKDTMISNGQAIIDEELSKMQDGPEKEKRKKELEEENIRKAEKFAFGVYATNVGVLGVSNLVQFPSIFAPRKIISSSAARAENDLASHLAFNAQGQLQKRAITKLERSANIAKAVAKPFTEALEETLQGITANTAANYHERNFRAKASGEKMIEPFANFTESLKDSFKEDYLEEATIGLIVGMIGGPSVKRNANNKIRPTLHNEMFSDIKKALASRSPEQEAILDEAIRFSQTAGKDGAFDAMKYRYAISKEDILSKEAEDAFEENGDESSLETLRQDKIFQNAKSFIERGMDFAIDEQIKDAKKMSLDEFRKKMSDDSITQEQKDDVVKNFEEKTSVYRKNYSKVYKGMNMEKLKDNETNKDLLATLVYSMSNFEAQEERLNKSISAVSSSSAMSEEKLNELLDLHGEFDSITKDEIKKLTQEFSKAKEDLNKNKQKPNKVKKALRRRSVNKRSAEKTGEENAKKLEELNKTLEEEKAVDRKEQSEKIKVASEEIRAAKKEAAKNNINAVASKRNGTSRFLGGKQQKLLTSEDLKRYEELMNEFLNGINNEKENPTSPRSIKEIRAFFSSTMERSELKRNLNEAAHVFNERRESLDIMTHLYGIRNYDKAYSKIKAARMEALRSKIEEETKMLVEMNVLKAVKQDKLTKEEKNLHDTKEASLVSSLSRNKSALAEEIDEEEEVKDVEEGSLSRMRAAIEAAEDIISAYEDTKKHEEEQEKEALSEVKTEGKEEVTAEKEASSDPVSLSKQELEEAKAAFSFGIPERESKGSFHITTRSSETGKPDKNNEISDALESGDLKIGNITYFSSGTEDFSLTEEQKSLMTPEQQAMYESGRLAVLEKKGDLLKNKELSKIVFKEDGVTFENDISKNPLANIQFFLMTYRLEMEVSNDVFEGKEIRKKGPGERFSITGKYMYSPYEVFGKDSDKNVEIYKQRVDEAQEELDNVVAFLAANEANMTEQQLNVAKNKVISSEVKLAGLKARKNDEAMLNARIDYVLDKVLNETLTGKENQVFVKPVKILSVYAGDVVRNLDENGDRQVNQINNFPLVKPVIEVEGAFTQSDTDEFLSDSDTAAEMFENGELLLCVGGSHYGNVRMLNMKTGEEKIVSVKDDENWKNYSVGSLYYKHENSFGGYRNVKLFNSNIGEVARGQLLNQIEKYIAIAIDKMIQKDSVGDESKILIDNEEVEIEEGDFFGMFDNRGSKTIRIQDLMLHFLPVQKSFRSDEGTVARRMYIFNANEYSEGEGLDRMKKTLAETEDFDDDVMTSEKVASFENEKAARAGVKKKKAGDTLEEKKPENKVMAFPGTIDFSFGEIKEDEERKSELIKVISAQISQMRFNFDMNQYLEKSKEKDSKERSVKDTEAFNILFSTGLISHPFRTSMQRDKIYEKEEKVTKFNKDGSVTVVKKQSAPITVSYKLQGQTGRAKNVKVSYKRAIDFFKKKQLPVRVRALFGIKPEGNLNKKEVVKHLLKDQFKGLVEEINNLLLDVNDKKEIENSKALSEELKGFAKGRISYKDRRLKNMSNSVNIKLAYKKAYEKNIVKILSSIRRRAAAAVKGIEAEIERIKREEANQKGSIDALVANLEEYIEVLKEIDTNLQKEINYNSPSRKKEEGENSVQHAIRQNFIGATILSEVMPVVLYGIATNKSEIINFVETIVQRVTSSTVSNIKSNKAIDAESYEDWQLMEEISIEDLDMSKAIDLAEDANQEEVKDTEARAIDVDSDMEEALSETERLIFNPGTEADSEETNNLISEARAKQQELILADSKFIDLEAGESADEGGKMALSNFLGLKTVIDLLNEKEIDKLLSATKTPLLNEAIFDKKISEVEKLVKEKINNTYTKEKGKSEAVEDALKRGAARAYAKSLIYLKIQERILELQQEKIEQAKEPVIKQPDIEIKSNQSTTETQPQAKAQPQAEDENVDEVSPEVAEYDAELKAKEKTVDLEIPELDIKVEKGGIFSGEFLNDFEFLAEGSEHTVYKSKDGKTVIKIGEPHNSNETYQSRVNDAIAINNLLGDGSLEVIGTYKSPNGTINPVYRQNFIAGEIVTQEQVAEHLINNGFTQTGKDTFTINKDGKTLEISDTSDNFIINKDGEIVAIDASIKEVESIIGEYENKESEEKEIIQEKPKEEKVVLLPKKKRNSLANNSASTGAVKKNESVQEKVSEENPENNNPQEKPEAKDIVVPAKVKMKIREYVTAEVSQEEKSAEDYEELISEYKEISSFVQDENIRRKIHKGMFSYISNGKLKEYVKFEDLEKDNNCNA